MEGFEVRPEYLGGFANLLGEVSSDLAGIQSVLRKRVHPAEGNSVVTGALADQQVVGAQTDFWHAHDTMLMHRQGTAVETAVSLNAAAWQYWQADDAARRALPPGAISEGVPFDGSVPYPRRFDPKAELAGAPWSTLPSPDTVYGSITRDLVDGFGAASQKIGLDDGTLGDVLTHWVLSDWRVLDNIGHGLARTANALNQCDANLQHGHSLLDPHWNGGAAQAFADYLGRYTHALRDQAAAMRLAGETCRSTAVALQKLAAEMVRVVGMKMANLALELGTGFQIAGRLGMAGKGALNMISNAVKAIGVSIKVVIEDYIQVLDAVRDVLGAVTSYLGGVHVRPDAVTSSVSELGDLYRSFSSQVPGMADAAGIAARAVGSPDAAELVETPTGMADAPTVPYSPGLTPEERSRPGE